MSFGKGFFYSVLAILGYALINKAMDMAHVRYTDKQRLKVAEHLKDSNNAESDSQNKGGLN